MHPHEIPLVFRAASGQVLPNNTYLAIVDDSPRSSQRMRFPLAWYEGPALSSAHVEAAQVQAQRQQQELQREPTQMIEERSELGPEGWRWVTA